MNLGAQVPDEALEHRINQLAPNKCCTLIYTVLCLSVFPVPAIVTLLLLINVNDKVSNIQQCSCPSFITLGPDLQRILGIS